MRRSGKARPAGKSSVRFPDSREYRVDVNPISEHELKGAYAGTQVELEPPRALLHRLELVDRLMRESPAGETGAPQVVWRDAEGRVTWATIGEVPLIVGRDPGCAVVLAGACVSRRHCRVHRLAGPGSAIEVEDLGSSNGTKVNGVALPTSGRRLLADGDVIEVGGIPLVVIRDAAV